MNRRHVVLLVAAATLVVTACKNIQQNSNSGGTQTVVQGVQANITYAGEGKGGIKIKDGEAISNIVLKDKNNNSVPVTLDSGVATELQTVDPAPSGYHWAGFRAAGISSSLAPYSLGYEITGALTQHPVTERARIGQSWADPDCSLVVSFDVGPTTSFAGSGVSPWGIALLLAFLVVLAVWVMRSRLRTQRSA